MGGCFGNSQYDRHLERQLYDHLDKESKWETYWEAVANEVPLEIWDAGFREWFQGDECNDLLIKIQFDSEDLKVIADKLIEAYNKRDGGN